MCVKNFSKYGFGLSIWLSKVLILFVKFYVVICVRVLFFWVMVILIFVIKVFIIFV